MYAVEPLHPGLWLITLPCPAYFPHPPFSAPLNVYALCKPGRRDLTLLHAGDIAHREPLEQALGSIGFGLGDVARVLSTSWMPHCILGARHLPRATLGLWSPDLFTPTEYGAWFKAHTAAWRALSVELAQDAEDASQMQALWAQRAQGLPGTLEFLPLLQGQELDAGGWGLEVIGAPGPQPGHVVFFAREEGVLFGGEMTFEGWPVYLQSLEDYLASVGALLELPVEVVLPNTGWPKPAHALHRGGRFLQNFISHIPHILNRGQTLEQVVMDDLGYRPSSTLRYATRAYVLRGLLEDLARARLISAQGEGLSRRYGDAVGGGTSVGARMVQVQASGGLVVPQVSPPGDPPAPEAEASPPGSQK